MYSIRSITGHCRLGLLQLTDFVKVKGDLSKREAEKQGTLFLLDKLFEGPVSLAYTNEGKPYLENKSCHISITHSHDKLAIMVNDRQTTGIDIELIRDKVLKIKHKFLSADELKQANDDVQKLITYWSCKEALYKFYSKKEVDFVEHLYIEPFSGDSGETIGQIKIDTFNKKIQLHFEKTDDYMLTYTLNELN